MVAYQARYRLCSTEISWHSSTTSPRTRVWCAEQQRMQIALIEQFSGPNN